MKNSPGGGDFQMHLAATYTLPCCFVVRSHASCLLPYSSL